MLVCGVDEVGCGALAGAVVAAAVVYGKVVTDGLRDSKKLTPIQRQRLSEKIYDDCMCFSFGQASVEEINRLNIRVATLLAMQRAVSGIIVCPDVVRVDGNEAPDFPYPSETIVGGDDKVNEIMAASIIAKVRRDRMMIKLHDRYPHYNFRQNKGYPTPAHLDALEKFGVTSQHRKSFSPINRIIGSGKNNVFLY